MEELLAQQRRIILPMEDIVTARPTQLPGEDVLILPLQTAEALVDMFRKLVIHN